MMALFMVVYLLNNSIKCSLIFNQIFLVKIEENERCKEEEQSAISLSRIIFGQGVGFGPAANQSC
jgi:hypothetical protein